MFGAIIGDIVGSRFEFDNHRSKDFSLFAGGCFATDDSYMTIAIAKALLLADGDVDKLSELAVKCMREIGQPHSDCGFGGRFFGWMYSDNPTPYGSYGNGAAMRISPVGFAANTIDEAKALSRAVTAVTHNHPEGLKGAEATAVAIVLAKQRATRDDIRDYISKNYYELNFTLDEIRPFYQFDESCMRTVPQALVAFFESTDYEDAIRNAISLGGDSDTIAAICGGVAESYYGVPDSIVKRVVEEKYLDDELLDIIYRFEKKYQSNNQ